MISKSEFHRLLNHHKTYSFHPEDHLHKLKHLSASGGDASLIKALETPSNMRGAELLLYKLAQRVGMDSDAKKTSGARSHPAHGT